MNNKTTFSDVQYFETMLLARAVKYPKQRQKLKLEPDHLTDERNRAIYEDILNDLDIDTEKILTNAIKDSERYGGYEYVQEILDNDVVTENGIITDQANIFNYYKQREISRLSEYYLQHPSDDMARELNETINRLNQFDLGERDTKRETLSEIMDELFEEQPDTVIKSNIQGLDDVIDGFEMQQLNVVAARPSMGKTAFAIELAKGLSMSECDVNICSLETHEKAITRRLLSNLSKVDLYKFKDAYNRMTYDDIQKVLEAIDEYYEMPIRVKSESKFTPNSIRRIANNSNPDRNTFIIIDYLQLMSSDKESFKRYDEVSEISRQIKIIAQEYPNISIIALSQLNRGVESRQDKRPMMSDLKESGQIEQDSNIIMMLYRDDYYNEPEEPNSSSMSPLEVIVAKNRDGMIGTSNLEFYKNIQKIY